MKTKEKENFKNFFVKFGVIITGIVLVMYLAKVWFISRKGVPNRKGKDISSSYESLKSKNNIKIINWQDAGKHYGEYVTVEGQIVITYNSGKACFLNFHRNYRLYFTAVIFASDFHKFKVDPETLYYGKNVQITGKIKQYKGKPEITVNNPEQIKIIE